MLSITVDGNISIVIQVDTMNLNNADKISQELKKVALSTPNKDIIIDFKQVHTIDSSAIAMLVKFVQHLTGLKRKMSIIHATENVRTSIGVLKLTSFLGLV